MSTEHSDQIQQDWVVVNPASSNRDIIRLTSDPYSKPDINMAPDSVLSSNTQSRTSNCDPNDLICMFLQRDSESETCKHHGIGAIDLSVMETDIRNEVGKNLLNAVKKKEGNGSVVGVSKSRTTKPRNPRNKEEETRKKMEELVLERHKRIAERSAALGARSSLENGKKQVQQQQHQLRKQQRLVNK